MHSAPAAASTPASISKPPRARCSSIAAPPRWSRSRRTASIPIGIDGIVLSHLHGDHFGGLPFLLLDAQFLARRERPLLIAGPPGTRARLDALLEVFFPRSTGNEMAVSLEGHGDRGRPSDRCAGPFGDDRRGRALSRARPRPRCGSPTATNCSPIPATPSGSRRWSRVADGADLFMIECYGYSGRLTGHLTWEILERGCRICAPGRSCSPT